MSTGFFKDRTILVTGGAGLIGSYLVEQLLEFGGQVIVVDDFSKGSKNNLEGVLDKIEIREGDLEDYGFAQNALTNCDYVFHLASRAYGVGYSSTHHHAMLYHNERITNNLFSVLQKTRLKGVQVVSSSCVYSDDGPDLVPELPLFTGEPERVNWGYGWAKRFLEQKAMIFSAETSIPVSIVRPFNIYGERYRWVGNSSQAIPMLVKRVLDKEEPVIIWGSGDQRRNYLHAHDCARAMARIMAVEFNGTVNIGMEETVSLRELVSIICRIAGLNPKFSFDLDKPEGRRIKSSDTTLLRSILGDQPIQSVSFDDGITRMLAWYHSIFASNK